MKIPVETKPFLWGIAGGALAMAVVGFTWGGWVTGSKAESVASERATDAVVTALAPICVDKFQHAAEAAANGAALKKTDAWSQAEFVEKRVIAIVATHGRPAGRCVMSEGSPACGALVDINGALLREGLAGQICTIVGIGIAYYLYILRPEIPATLIRRFGWLHTFLVNKWYFDELIDVLVVRPALGIGRFANRVFERFVVDGLVTGTEETVRGASTIAHRVQNGFVRSYALLLVVGIGGLALYFLIVQS